jgi:hypothetical protein
LPLSLFQHGEYAWQNGRETALQLFSWSSCQELTGALPQFFEAMDISFLGLASQKIHTWPVLGSIRRAALKRRKANSHSIREDHLLSVPARRPCSDDKIVRDHA